MTVEGVQYQTFEDNTANALTATLERVFYHKLPGAANYTIATFPSDFSIRVAMTGFLSAYRRCCHVTSPWTHEQFVDHTRPAKRAVYQRAAESLIHDPLRARDAQVRGFLKWEKLPVQSKRTVPRLISPRDPRLNLEIGCYLKRIELDIYKNLSRVMRAPRTVVGKGLNAEQIAQVLYEDWCEVEDPVAFILDASRFDAHCRSGMLIVSHEAFSMHYTGEERKRFRKFLKYQLSGHVLIVCPDGSVRYSLSTRCSGEMDTASGNTLISIGMLYEFLTCVGIPTADVRVLANGDDVIMIMPRKYQGACQVISSYYLSHFGFVMKVEGPRCEFEQCTFCQCNPVFDGSKWRMVRMVPQCLSKDATIVHYLPNSEFLRDYLHTVGLCGLSLASGIPILQEYYAKLASLGHRCVALEECGMTYLAAGLSPLIREIVPATRASFARAFGIMPDHQIAVERTIQALELSDLRLSDIATVGLSL